MQRIVISFLRDMLSHGYNGLFPIFFMVQEGTLCNDMSAFVITHQSSKIPRK